MSEERPEIDSKETSLIIIRYNTRPHATQRSEHLIPTITQFRADIARRRFYTDICAHGNETTYNYDYQEQRCDQRQTLQSFKGPPQTAALIHSTFVQH